jgi:hypothetical protein
MTAPFVELGGLNGILGGHAIATLPQLSSLGPSIRVVGFPAPRQSLRDNYRCGRTFIWHLVQAVSDASSLPWLFPFQNKSTHLQCAYSLPRAPHLVRHLVPVVFECRGTFLVMLLLLFV